MQPESLLYDKVYFIRRSLDSPKELEESKMATDPRKRNWTFLIYPDSAPENWEEIFASQNLPALISPLHDQDVNEADDEQKKPHYHVILQFRGKKTEQQAQEISDLFSGVKVKPVNDMRSLARYLCHLDNPEKAQYNIDDVKTYGGIDYQELIESAADIDNTLREIMDWCLEQGCDSFYVLSNYAAKEKPSWFRVITTKRSMFLMNYLKSKAWTDLQHQQQIERNKVKPDNSKWTEKREKYQLEIEELIKNSPDSEEPF